MSHNMNPYSQAMKRVGPILTMVTKHDVEKFPKPFKHECVKLQGKEQRWMGSNNSLLSSVIEDGMLPVIFQPPIVFLQGIISVLMMALLRFKPSATAVRYKPRKSYVVFIAAMLIKESLRLVRYVLSPFAPVFTLGDDTMDSELLGYICKASLWSTRWFILKD